MFYNNVLRTYKMLLLVFVIAAFTQCKPNSPEQEALDQKHKAIMAVHDDVMPKMKDIYKLRKELKGLESSQNVTFHLGQLEAADEAMMSWMHEYKKPKIGQENYQSYLNKQEKKD